MYQTISMMVYTHGTLFSSSVKRSFERIPTLWWKLKEIPKQLSVIATQKCIKIMNLSSSSVDIDFLNVSLLCDEN